MYVIAFCMIPMYQVMTPSFLLRWFGHRAGGVVIVVTDQSRNVATRRPCTPESVSFHPPRSSACALFGHCLCLCNWVVLAGSDDKAFAQEAQPPNAQAGTPSVERKVAVRAARAAPVASSSA